MKEIIGLKKAGIVILLSLLIGCATSQQPDQMKFENLSLQADLIERDIRDKNRDDIQEDTSYRQISGDGFYCIIDRDKTILAHPNQTVIGKNITELDSSLDSLMTDFLSGTAREVFGEYKNQRDATYRFCLRRIPERQYILLILQPLQ